MFPLQPQQRQGQADVVVDHDTVVLVTVPFVALNIELAVKDADGKRVIATLLAKRHRTDAALTAVNLADDGSAALNADAAAEGIDAVAEGGVVAVAAANGGAVHTQVAALYLNNTVHKIQRAARIGQTAGTVDIETGIGSVCQS